LFCQYIFSESDFSSQSIYCNPLIGDEVRPGEGSGLRFRGRKIKSSIRVTKKKAFRAEGSFYIAEKFNVLSVLRVAR
jgi:hypothetical protein